MNITVVGAGTIGEAISVALKNRGYDVTATRRNVSKIETLAGLGIRVSSKSEEAILDADVVILSLKPYDVLAFVKRNARVLAERTTISMAAALPISAMARYTGDGRLMRAMTNIAARVGGGFTVFCAPGMQEREKRECRKILECFGEVMEVEEKYMDALTAISGSGPAYILTVMEAMMYAGLKVGLPRDLALKASYETILGSAKLVSESGNHPSVLKDLVVTPGGVTIDAIYELEDSGIRTAFMRAIESATIKSRKISEEIASRDP
ncbi:pyrroline-5-carboxylate reductase [Thermogymnomonas acidicola]|uniref:Pyrroline-5-carboxylate reductase n=1 Tax=Thermogymnomonas acidicola TaxID=399579 RepID=A0AA37BRC1_9ARCH|nr:pyrroline-5-carboxylate reductase [Thermogymnomonas acidicola]GGM71355.1 pyrroline-5-carboxylate reductase [Thermogymnomonas acidicola]